MFLFDNTQERFQFNLLPDARLLLWGIGLGLVVTLAFFALSHFLISNYFPAELTIALAAIIGILPIVWLYTAKRHRLCLTLTTIILLTGDFAPALISPVVLMLTLSNCGYLIYRHRRSAIRWFLLPFLLLTGLYFANSFLWGFVDDPVMITRGQILDLGWAGAFGGGLILYHIVYLFMAIYHLACEDKAFIKPYMIVLSVVINLVVVIGLAQFGASLFSLGEAKFRIPSIMRLTTRLAPFVLTSLTLIVLNLLEKQSWGERSYWLLSLVMGLFLLLITQTRGAILGGGIIFAFLMLGFIRAHRQYWPHLMFGTLLLLGVGTVFFVLQGDTSYLERFTPEMFQSGLGKREVMWDQFWLSIQYQNTSIFRQMVHLLFGYGWFAERFYVFPHNMDAHNTFLSAFTSYGIAGSVLYFGPMFYLLAISVKRSFNAIKINMRPKYAMTAGLILVFMVTGFVHNKLYSPIESAYMWIMLGLLLKDDLPELFPEPKRLN